ncbi:MAG TPA: hypothetical protein PJ982_18335 [Lacipirellulaceae bacterium]|nr:hypothetical protein [Lacipirellulaceae bacterium]
MKPFTVVWQSGVQAELASLWLAADDREAVAQAANEIERKLSRDPTRYGLPIKEGLYSIEAPPLRVLFEIREADRIVEVACARLCSV